VVQLADSATWDRISTCSGLNDRLGDVCIALTVNWSLYRQGLAWNAVLFHGPCAQISHLATF